MSLIKHPERRLDPPDETNVECPECGGFCQVVDVRREDDLAGIMMSCPRCDGEGYIDVKREAQEAKEEWAERVAEDDFNRV
jgi:DnaJ-class molecular chaperone